MDAHRLSVISQYSDDPSVYPQDYPSPVSAGPPPRSNGPTSMLDLGDDPTPSDDEDAHVDSAARLSYMGPKMRFHSRAPWEMDNDVLEEEDEESDVRLHLTAGLPFGRTKAAATSPRPSFQTSRASGESSRSHIPPKRSFETVNSQISYPLGALYALAHETMSATALSRPKETLRSKFSLGRLRPDTSSGSLPPPPLPPLSPARSHFQPSPPPFDGAHEPIHPYANPDHAAAYDDDEQRPSFPTNLYSPSRNDSSMTVTEPFPGDAFSRTSLRSATTVTIPPDSSSNSLHTRTRATTVSARNISAPVAVLHAPEPDRSQDRLPTQALPLGTSLAGWHERAPPAFSLISLEEARAQRMRTSTAESDAPRASISTRTFPRSHTSNSSIDGSESASIFPDASFGNSAPRPRGRSISAGAKAKSALHIIVGQSKNSKDTDIPAMPATAPGKTLKQKKSGFMRLFNGGKSQEREESFPPPVPALPEHAQQRSGKAGIQRIPVPSLSPSLIAAVAAETGPDEPLWSASLVTSPKRTPPTLSITTAPVRSSSIPEDKVPQLASSTNSAQTLTAPRPAADQLPQSAPANVSSFNALRLRPMSTLFSAQFSEHIVPLDTDEGSARSSGDTDVDTPEPALDTPLSASPGMPSSPLKSALYVRTPGEQNTVSDGAAPPLPLGPIQITQSKTDAQRIWELEGRVRDLQDELQALRGKHGDAFCIHCGRGKRPPVIDLLGPNSVVNRPRARTGTSSRFGNAMP